MMQGGFVSPTLFNVISENVIQTWMAMMVEDYRVEHDVMGEAIGRRL